MSETGLILTLAGGLGAALVCGYLTQRLGLSPIVGYLMAGVLVGPHTPGFTADTHLAEQFAEVGVILLMFGVGLQFHIDELLAVRRVAIPGAVLQSLVSAGLPHASTLIVSGGDTGSPGVIQCARSINPTAHILVRSHYLRDVGPLRQAGAEQVFSGEGEVALAMTEAVLRRLGATPDQIDRERARVREELMPGDGSS
jgi:Kef-type K+ transport system membrane component KefB